jgi:HK97 family phage portal protein
MGVFPTLKEVRSRERQSNSLPGTDDFWYGVAGRASKAGVNVTETTALNFLAVFDCVSLISGDMARLPLILYRRTSMGKERAVDHPLYDILHSAPNPEMTSFNFREAGQNHLLLWGNHMSVVERASLSGRVLAVWPLADPGQVRIRREPDGRISYTFKMNGRTVTKFRNEMFHVPGFGFDGIRGQSVIRYSREAIAVGLAAEEFGARYFGDGMHAGGHMDVPHDLGEQEAEYKERLRKEYAGLKNSHGILITQNGEKFTPFSMPLDDAQFLETRTFQKIEICGMYHVPPHKIAIHGQNSNYNNLEQENGSYVDSCLMHWITRWEQAISLQLLTPAERKAGYFAEFLVEGLLRGDSVARADYYNKLFNVGGITINQICDKENFNRDPSPAADKRFVMLNMIPLDRADDVEPPAAQGAAAGRFVSGTAEHRAMGSVLLRDRITRQYLPLIRRAAERIVNRETIAVKRQMDKQAKERAEISIDAWLADFYRDLPEYIKTEIGPVFESFCRAISDAAGDETGKPMSEAMVRQFVSDYVDTFAGRHAADSLGQLRALLADPDTAAAAIEERVNEWSETRPEKITINESVRAGSAVYQAVAFAAGLATVWKNRGAETCPYCKELNGRRVAYGQWFASDGEEINPSGGTGPMKINGIKKHPPLHQGCDCYLEVGR